MVNNKVDLYIDALRKDDFIDDPFSVSMDVANEMSADEIIEQVNKRVKELQGELQEAQNKARRNLEIVALPCYLKRDEGMKHEEVVRKYNIVNVVKSILLQTAEFLVRTSVKIPITLVGEEDVDVEINQDELFKCVRAHILESETDKKVFEPGSKNIGDNMGICPHGNSYNALKRRLRYGDGYSCKIEENYYINCKSFTIDFTGNLRNFISENFISHTVHMTMKLVNGRFPGQKEEELFWKQVARNVDAKKFVSILLYDKAMRDAELTGFGFGTYFRGFLNNSIPYFYKGMIDENQYVDALGKVLKDAVKKTIALNVIYK